MASGDIDKHEEDKRLYRPGPSNLVSCFIGPSLFKTRAIKDPVAESMSQHRASVPPAPDKRLMRDSRLLNNLQASEEQWNSVVDYLRAPCKQPKLEPYMRKMVVDWMSDICVEVRADWEVFPLSVCLLDRFLSIEHIFSTQLQGLAAACLLLASKVKQPYPFTIQKLSDFTDSSVPAAELLSWELLVLNKLKWNVASVTPLEYVSPLLARIDLDSITYHHITSITQEFVYLCMRELQLCTLPPSMLAAACLCAGFGQLFAGHPFVSQLHNAIPNWINADSEILQSYTDLVVSVGSSASSELAVLSSVSRSASTDSGYNSSICQSPLSSN